MATHTRSNTELRRQLTEFSAKSEAEYSAWYNELKDEERTFVDSKIEAFNARVKSSQEKSPIEGLKVTTDPRSSVGQQSQALPAEITEAEISAMWTAIDMADVSSIDQDALKIFEYQGFDPKMILLSLMKAKKRNNVADDVFKADILTLCAISIIKGSINNNNIKKISEEGQQVISRLETTYGIKRGSGRKEKPEVVTVSRIGATFPGKIIQLICAEKVQSRLFAGPFSSSHLPPFMRHQAFAAVIPKSLKTKTREFLISLITAFSVDQSIQINPNKKEKIDPASLYSSQSNFISVTHNGLYPPEHTKIIIFKTLVFEYDSLLIVAKKVASIVGGLSIPSADEFNSDILLVE